MAAGMFSDAVFGISAVFWGLSKDGGDPLTLKVAEHVSMSLVRGRQKRKVFIQNGQLPVLCLEGVLNAFKKMF